MALWKAGNTATHEVT